MLLLTSLESYLPYRAHFMDYSNKVDACLGLCLCDIVKAGVVYIFKCLGSTHLATWNSGVVIHRDHFSVLVKDEAVFILGLSVLS